MNTEPDIRLDECLGDIMCFHCLLCQGFIESVDNPSYKLKDRT